MKNVLNYLLLLLPVILVLLLAWWMWYSFPKTELYFRLASKSEPFGQQRNTERLKLGLPLLPDGWYTRAVPVRRGKSGVIDGANASYQLWSDFEHKHQPYYREKEVHRQRGEWVSETDRYAHCPNDSTTWVVELTYHFPSRKRGQEPRTATWIETVENASGQRLRHAPLSMVQADSILQGWKLR